MSDSPQKSSFISTDNPSDLFMPIDIIKTENGILGKFFGGSKQAPSNIAGFSLIALFLILGYLIWPNQNQNIISSVFSSITMILGFLFGKDIGEK